MKREIIITADGSSSISIPEMNVTYHSVHGAIQESLSVFINAGFRSVLQSHKCSILEVGFGTGLNALLTAIDAKKTGKSIYYVALEPFPLNEEQVHSLNYCELLGRTDLQSDFMRMHQCGWNKGIVITEHLLMHKSNCTLQSFHHKTKFDLIYFDAFAPNVQAELWTKEIFEKMFAMVAPGGVLVTYCSKGDVRRAMQAAGFIVEKLPGPKGKREMIRATKNQDNRI